MEGQHKDLSHEHADLQSTQKQSRSFCRSHAIIGGSAYFQLNAAAAGGGGDCAHVSQVQIHGGNVSETLVPETTHVVISGGCPSGEAALKPIDVMQGVAGCLGGLGSLRLFRHGLLGGRIKLVSPR